MAEMLEKLSVYLLQNLYDHDVGLLKDAKDVNKTISNLREKTILPPIFNINHVVAKHARYYAVKSCKGEHCFECLNNDITEGKLTCEHNAELTPFEISHIQYLFANTK